MDQPDKQIEQETQESTSARKTFIQELLQHVEFFCQTVMTAVPELNGIAIIPVWENQPENIPPGFLQLRNAEPPYINSLLKLQQRLTVFSMDVNKDMATQLRMFDEYAAHLKEEIEKQLNILEEAKNLSDEQKSETTESKN